MMQRLRSVAQRCQENCMYIYEKRGAARGGGGEIVSSEVRHETRLA